MVSGIEGAALILGAVSSIMTIIDTVAQVSSTIRHETGLPSSFREVDQRLPLIQDTLRVAKVRLSESPLDEESCKALQPTLNGCQKKVVQLDTIFKKTVRPSSSRLSVYVAAVHAVGNGNKVSLLMKGILEDIQLFTGHAGLKTATMEQLKQLGEAIAEISPNTPADSAYTASNRGILTVYNGVGNQNLSLEGGKQFIAEVQNFGLEQN